MSSYRDTRILGVKELQAFFEAVDRYLTTRASIVVIGGAAAAFHRAESTTSDVDTLDALAAEVRTAVNQVVSSGGISVPISASTVAQVPDCYDERLEKVLPHLERLEVWILERHDLALSKIVRGFEHDMLQLEEIHRNRGLDFETLMNRFRAEMGSVVGDPARIRLNFLELVERLFGELKRVSAEQRLK